jgi:tripartite-type tricarboxylate transporter receptor subunit TctC
LIALLAVTSTAPVRAQDYPSKTITIVVSIAAGTGMDVVARLYADKLQTAFGKSVVVENKPGGATTIAANAVANAPPDGHTMVVLTSGALAINPALFKQLSYDPNRDFAPISYYVKSPFILVVDPRLPVRTVPEFVKYAKEAKPALTYTSLGAGGIQHLTMEYAKQRLGFEATNVPYRNTGQSVSDIAAGHVAMGFVEAGASLPLIKEGKLRALAVSSSNPLPLLPDVPPMAEATGMPDFETISWHVLLAPSKTPKGVVDRLHEEMRKIMSDADMKTKVANIGLIPIDSPSVDGIRAYIKDEQLKWGSLVERLGLKGTQ